MRTSYGGIGEISFMLNPAGDKISGRPERSSEWVLGSEVPKREYVGNEGENFVITLLFDDAYEMRDGLCHSVLDLIRKYTTADPGTGSPPAVFYNYGAAIQTFVTIEHYEVEVHLRDSDNNIKRCEIEFELKEYKVGDTTRTPREQRGRQYVIASGNSTFRKLALAFLGDANLWEVIYDANSAVAVTMAGNAIIPSGTEIVIPAWDDIVVMTAKPFASGRLFKLP